MIGIGEYFGERAIARSVERGHHQISNCVDHMWAIRGESRSEVELLPLFSSEMFFHVCPHILKDFLGKRRWLLCGRHGNIE